MSKNIFTINLYWILIVLMFTSCHPLFCSWQSGYDELQYQPSVSEVSGMYELSDASKDYLNEHYHVWPLKLQLFTDKRFRFVTAGSETSGNDMSGIPDRVSSGIWSVYFNKKYKSCLMELEGINVEPLCERDGQISIMITIGDGDECNGIVYEKVE